MIIYADESNLVETTYIAYCRVFCNYFSVKLPVWNSLLKLKLFHISFCATVYKSTKTEIMHVLFSQARFQLRLKSSGVITEKILCYQSQKVEKNNRMNYNVQQWDDWIRHCFKAALVIEMYCAFNPMCVILITVRVTLDLLRKHIIIQLALCI